MRYRLSKIRANPGPRDLYFATREAGIGILVIKIHILPRGVLEP